MVKLKVKKWNSLTQRRKGAEGKPGMFTTEDTEGTEEYIFTMKNKIIHESVNVLCGVSAYIH